MSIELLNSNCSGSQHTEHPQLLSVSLIPRAAQNLMAFHWEAQSTSLIPLEFGIYYTYSAFVPDFIPTTCCGNWGSTNTFFSQVQQCIHTVSNKHCIITPQNSEQAKTSLLKHDRGARVFIVKSLMKLGNWEKQMWDMLWNRDKRRAVLGQGLELEEAEQGVSFEVLRDGVLVFFLFSVGSKEQVTAGSHLIHVIKW